MVAGGVGLAPFVTLAEALIARGTPSTLFYGARRAEDLHCADIFERLGVPIVFSTEDGSRGIPRLHHRPARRAPHGHEAGATRCGSTSADRRR